MGTSTERSRQVLSLGLASMTLTAAGAADLTRLVINTDTQPTEDSRWDGWATHDLLEFRAVATWRDGGPDPDLSRAGASPVWRTDYGWFETPKTGLARVTMALPPAAERRTEARGARVLWCSGFGVDGAGTIRVSYGGREAAFRVRARQPTRLGDPRLPGDYFDEVLLQEEQETLTQRLKGTLAPRQTKLIDHRFEIEAYAKLKAPERAAYWAAEEARAHQVSAKLEQAVRQWLAGPQTPTELPAGLLPESLHNWKTRWVLCRPDAVAPEEAWFGRLADDGPADFAALPWGGADPHGTSLKLLVLAPLGCRLVVEGEYPHARFFGLQVSPPFDPRFPSQVGGTGATEVPIVDADIAPDPGQVNPYRPGADRTAGNRRYHVRFRLEAGNAVALNEALNPGSMTPGEAGAYRAAGDGSNTRVGGPFRAMLPIHGWSLAPAVLWLRCYAPDRGTGPLGGVSLPRVHLELPTGEVFWLRVKDTRLLARRQALAVPATSTPDAVPVAPFTSAYGWAKYVGLTLAVVDGLGQAIAAKYPKHEGRIRSTVREIDGRLAGRGSQAPPPGNLEPTAGSCAYTTYTVRGITCGRGHVVVFTGRRPRAPATRDGEPRMDGGEIRAFGLSHYLPWHGDPFGRKPELLYPMTSYGSLLDDEIVTPGAGPSQDWYIIAYSRREDRPRNAGRENGVTWQDWGPAATQAAVVRWLSVGPEWRTPAWAPDAPNLPRTKVVWSEPGFDPALLSRNRRGSFMGDQHVLVHYLSREQFEALGEHPDPRAMPGLDGW